MNDKPKWQVARLDDIERRGRDIPVREHLGIHAFGINAYTPSEDGTLISEHDESGSGQEELYIVLDGKATFEVDGEAFDAVWPQKRRYDPERCSHQPCPAAFQHFSPESRLTQPNRCLNVQ